MNFLRLVQTALGLMLVLAAFPTWAFAQMAGPCGTPEIDPGSLATGLALVSGGVLLITDRFRSPR
jgi:hypothetical protein